MKACCFLESDFRRFLTIPCHRNLVSDKPLIGLCGTPKSGSCLIVSVVPLYFTVGPNYGTFDSRTTDKFLWNQCV